MDDRLRAAEREEPAPDARARVFAERLRLGRITPAQVETAALLGDPAARACLGRTPSPPARGVVGWWEATFRRDPQAGARSACAAAGAALRRVGAEAAPDVLRQAEQRLRLAMDCCVCPCWVHGRLLDAAPTAPFAPSARDRRVRACLELVRWAVQRTLRVTFAVPDEPDVSPHVQALRALGFTRDDVRGLVRDAVAPWLLGDEDPCLAPERREELVEPRVVALAGPTPRPSNSLLIALDQEAVIAATAALDAHIAAGAPTWVRSTRWTFRLTDARVFLYGPGGLSLALHERVAAIRSFVPWAELPATRDAHRAAVGAIGRALGARRVLWAPDDAAALHDAARAGAGLDDLPAPDGAFVEAVRPTS